MWRPGREKAAQRLPGEFTNKRNRPRTGGPPDSESIMKTLLPPVARTTEEMETVIETGDNNRVVMQDEFNRLVLVANGSIRGEITEGEALRIFSDGMRRRLSWCVTDHLFCDLLNRIAEKLEGGAE